MGLADYLPSRIQDPCANMAAEMRRNGAEAWAWRAEHWDSARVIEQLDKTGPIHIADVAPHEVAEVRAAAVKGGIDEASISVTRIRRRVATS